MNSAAPGSPRVALAAVAALAVATGALLAVGVDWTGWRPASCMPDGCFCEAVDPARVIAQPANTWSSFTYVAAGLAMLVRSWLRPATGRGMFGALPMVASAFALSVVAVGLGSAFLHATLTFAGQFTDVFGMYWVGTFIGVFALWRLRRWPARTAALVWAGSNVALGCGLLLAPESRRVAFAGVLLAGIALELIALRSEGGVTPARHFLAGIGVFAGAYGIWLLDNARVLCDPTSVLQGHAVWHVLGASATLLLFEHYRRPSPRYTPSA